MNTQAQKTRPRYTLIPHEKHFNTYAFTFYISLMIFEHVYQRSTNYYLKSKDVNILFSLCPVWLLMTPFKWFSLFQYQEISEEVENISGNKG